MGKFYAGLADGLTPYVRMCAWLEAVPDPPPGDKKLAALKVPRRSRRQALRDNKEIPVLPPAEEGFYLVEYLFEAGPVESTGMGAVVLSWRELRAWQKTMGITLAPFEGNILRRLSQEYLAESQRATDPDCPPPWSPTLTARDRDDISKRIREGFRMLIATHPRNAARP